MVKDFVLDHLILVLGDLTAIFVLLSFIVTDSSEEDFSSMFDSDAGLCVGGFVNVFAIVPCIRCETNEGYGDICLC